MTGADFFSSFTTGVSTCTLCLRERLALARTGVSVFSSHRPAFNSAFVFVVVVIVVVVTTGFTSSSTVAPGSEKEINNKLRSLQNSSESELFCRLLNL